MKFQQEGCSSIVLCLVVSVVVGYSAAAVDAKHVGVAVPTLPEHIATLNRKRLTRSIVSIPRGGETNDSATVTIEVDMNAATTAAESAATSASAKILAADPPAVPSIADYRNFALPCLGLWVAQPLLSLVDTAFVGLSGDSSQSAQQLAALGPATTFFDGATYLFAFLNVAATNIYASARAQVGEQSERAESVVRVASKLALNCGIGIMLFLFAFARPLLALYIGSEAAATPGLLDSAVEYVKIRAFSMPTSLLLGVVQACLLGAKDSVTPLIAILYSTIVNLIGDYVLVSRLQMGLKGAAIATLMAQWAATFALLGPARRRLVRDHSFSLFKKVAKTENTVSGTSFLTFAAPVLTLIIGKLAAFGFMTHSAAAVPGQPTPLASHQIILSLFFFVSPFMEVISQTAQSFLPPYLAPVFDHIADRSKDDDGTFNPSTDARILAWRSAALKASNNLLVLGFMSAICIATLASLVPAFFANILTNDASVQNAVKPLARYLWAGAFLTGPVAVSEGVLLAQRELGYLAVIYLISTIVLPYALWQIKHGGTVEQVWACFVVFQLFRATAFVGRVWLGPILSYFRRGEKIQETVAQKEQ